MGDLFQDCLESSLEHLREKLNKENLAVTPERCFSGFNAFKKVLACDIDLVILATPPHFRPEHLEAAVKAAKHISMEKTELI